MFIKAFRKLENVLNFLKELNYNIYKMNLEISSLID